jgi:hypothetical protein
MNFPIELANASKTGRDKSSSEKSGKIIHMDLLVKDSIKGLKPRDHLLSMRTPLSRIHVRLKISKGSSSDRK